MGSIDDSKNHHLNGTSNDKSTTRVQELDALCVGAGFCGVYQLKVIRDAGYKVKLVEHGADYGGVWYWNRYPGARVDSHIPHYEFSDPALWKDWTWTQRFPGSSEIRAYFEYVAEKWDLRKDTQFNTLVSSATWDDDEARWTVKTEAGETYKVKFLLMNTGFAAKKHIPDWKGIDSYKGTFIHPSNWPHEGPNFNAKKVAIIGTGATGVQIAQELSETVSHLTIFQRTPNMSMPMAQVNYDLPSQAMLKSEYPEFFANRTENFSGFTFNFLPRSTFDDNPSERNKTYEHLWDKGTLEFWLASYTDMLSNKVANTEAYNFWRDKTRGKIHDPKIADILAPMTPPHAFGCKRISLENGYFEIFNKPNVSLVDTSACGTPIQEFTATGIKTTNAEYDFDYIISATGFDALTGGLTSIAITGSSGETLKEHWKHGAKTYLGLSVAGFPNMFFAYGPQAPTAFCNGPTCAEMQGQWILGAMEYVRTKEIKKIVARRESEEEYKEMIVKYANETLLPEVDSWYMGTNIPGKKREMLIYLGGVSTYYKMISDIAENGYTGFDLT